MSIENHVKLIVAPQIVIYKNIFDYSKEIIDLSNSYNESVLGKWSKWYSQGFRKGNTNYFHEELEINNAYGVREKEILKNYLDILKFIRKDYFKDFNKNNGIWPDFIKNWDYLLEEPNSYGIDMFKYDHNFAAIKNERLLLEYHVDEFQIPNKNSISRNVCTLNLYLNSNYSGGEICMYSSIEEKSYKYKPGSGDIVIMPSTSPFYHAVLDFRNADRYFIRSFFSYLEEEPLEKNLVSKLKEEDFVKNHLQTIQVLEKEIEVY
jgi:hypothetical protein